MQSPIRVRAIERRDYPIWLPLWNSYNEFYGRVGHTSLPESITRATWERFFNEFEPVFAFVAEEEGEIVGFVHYLFHRSTTRLNDVCYLQDLFSATHLRGRGIGRLLIQAVYSAAASRNCSRVYWTTYTSNETARALYDKVAEHLGVIVYTHEL